ncbi:MAG TPA: TldD/PmbA family protein [Acidimicrobiales bacterium]|nr:TldD/PmbA family protein [Acidimicrobiales bacterium]
MSDLLALTERVAGWAAEGEEVEAYVARSHHTEIKVFGGEVESLSSADTEGIGVRVVNRGRQGFAYAASLDEAALVETLAEARDNAAFATVDEFAGLACPDGVEPVELDLWRDELAAFPADDKVAIALEVDRATRAADPRIRGVETAQYGDSATESAVASSEGIRASSRRTVCSVYADAMAGEGTDIQTGYGYSVARRPDDLDVAKAAADAAFRTTRLLGARKPASRHLAVLFEPRVTASFLGLLSRAFSGESVLKGRSIFAGREGEKVAVPGFTLVDDPTNADAYGAARYDAEGLATRPNTLVDGGVVAGFLHNSYTGRRSGRASTGSAVRGGYKSTPGVGSRALVLSPGGLSQEELLAEVGEGLLVQSVTGLHSGANPVSGDFSVGIQGLMVRDGAPAEPVREATVASTLQRMLQDVVAVGSDLEWLPGGAAGLTLVVGDVALSGN